MTELVVVGVRDGQDGIEWYNWNGDISEMMLVHTFWSLEHVRVVGELSKETEQFLTQFV